jgi:2-polyprenyl-3-methyl-5-hydroxy-6-metoxy-1,4-benzoquinol methylase
MTTEKSNASLRETYDRIYRQGEENYFSKFIDGEQKSEVEEVVLGMIDWKGKSVLDVGCGTGSLVRKIAHSGASHVTGIDYSHEAIEIARATQDNPRNVQFVTVDLKDMQQGGHDVVVSCGTIEHSDDPSQFLARLSALTNDKADIVITCPHFINLRGFTWMTLANLLDVPMSLTDIHFIHPWHVKRWAMENSLSLESMSSFDYDRGNGAWMIHDLKKRLTNALQDAGLDNTCVDLHLEYLLHLSEHLHNGVTHDLEGATAAYLLQKT